MVRFHSYLDSNPPVVSGIRKDRGARLEPRRATGFPVPAGREGDVMRLDEVAFEKVLDLEEVVIWGINPMREIVEIMDEVLNESEVEATPIGRRLLWGFFELKDKLEDTEKAVFRYMDTVR